MGDANMNHPDGERARAKHNREQREKFYKGATAFQGGVSKGYEYNGKGKDFSWYDKAIGRGKKESEFQDKYGWNYYERNGRTKKRWAVVESAKNQFLAQYTGQEFGSRIKEANKLAYEKVLRGEISAADYKAIMSQSGPASPGEGIMGYYEGGVTTLGSYSEGGAAGKVAAFGKKQEQMRKSRTGTKTAMGQLAPGIREQSSEVVKGLLKNQAKETLLGKA